METWNRKTPLSRHICIVFLPLLINFAEPPQFTVSLILPPSAIPMKPIIAHLFILSTVSLKIIFVRRLAKSERIIRDFKHMINSFLVVLSKEDDSLVDRFPFCCQITILLSLAFDKSVTGLKAKLHNTQFLNLSLLLHCVFSVGIHAKSRSFAVEIRVMQMDKSSWWRRNANLSRKLAI